MEERIKCTNPKCNHMILIETAKKTGGLCMPCQIDKERQKREKYILENRKSVDLFKGITDKSEIIKIMHQETPYDPLILYTPYSVPIEEIYSQLTQEEIIRLIDFVKNSLDQGKFDLGESICLELVAFRDTDISSILEIMLKEHLYYPGILFKDANEELVNILLSRLENTTNIDNHTLNRNHILLALAWAGTQSVRSKFSEWISTPPTWAKELYVPPQNYSKDAGWILDKNLKQRKLYFDTSYPLLVNKKSEKSDYLSVCTLSTESCEWCNRKLTKLFEFDLHSSLFKFIPISGDKLIIKTCHVCSCFAESLFMDVSNDGSSIWSSYNIKPDYLPEDTEEWEHLQPNCLALTGQTRPAHYAANEFLPTAFSQIGGMPTWIQDFAYPTCPKCNKTMTFLAQISNEDIDEYGEGMYYSYICSTCKITATNYQQT